MKKLLLAASAITLFAAPPAHAQLLSGSGLGSITGSATGAIGPISRMPTDTLRSTTRGAVRGDANTRGSQNVDRRSGSVAIDRSVDGSLDATTSQLLDTPAGSAAGSASGSGNAAGSGSANAQLIGTDAVRGVAQETVGRTRDTVGTVRDRAGSTIGSARDRANGAVGQAGGLTGAARGAGSAAGSASGMLGNDFLAVAGSGAAAGEGAFAVAPGMPVMLPSGERLGEVRQIVADKRGKVQQVLVEARDRTMTLPAASLTGSGSALLMGEGALTAAQPAAEPAEESADETAE